MGRVADAVIAEVTQPSLGAGYEIGRADSWRKPILVLFYTPSRRRLSPTVKGNPNIQVVEYAELSELENPIANFIKQLRTEKR